MDLLESLRMAAKTLRTNKLRSGLTTLGIVIGNASVIALVGIGQGAQDYTLRQLDSFGPNRLVILPGGDRAEGLRQQEPTLVLSDAEAIANQAPAVEGVAPQISASVRFTQGSNSTTASAIGTSPSYLPITSTAIAQGRFFDRSEQQQTAQVAVLGPELAQRLFGNTNPLGKSIQINTTTFQIIGITEAKGSFLGINRDNVAYLPITTMASQIAGRRSAFGVPVDYIEFSAANAESVRAAQFQVTNILTRLHGEQDFRVQTAQSVQDLVQSITGILSLLLSAIAAISLIVGGIGIMNIMLVSVTERTQEIGLRKALGATQRDILTQFLIEAIILSVAGGVVGTVIGVGGTAIVGVFTPLNPSVPFSAIVFAVGVSGSIGLFFGVIPARQAAKLDPIEALRSM